MMRLQTSTSRKARFLSVAAALVVGAALAVGTAIAQQNQNFDNVQIDTVKVRDNVYMLVGAGGNTTVFTGSDGIMVVDTQFAPLSTKILSAIRAISDGPIRYIVNTHVHGDHIGGNESISKAGHFRAGGNVVGDLGAAATATAAIIAHENVLKRLSADQPAGQPQVPFAAWPTETYITKKREFLFTARLCRSSTSRTRTPTATASSSSARQTCLPPAICSRP